MLQVAGSVLWENAKCGFNSLSKNVSLIFWTTVTFPFIPIRRHYRKNIVWANKKSCLFACFITKRLLFLWCQINQSNNKWKLNTMDETSNLLLIRMQREMVTKAIDNLRETERLTGRSYENEINEMLDRLIALKEKEEELIRKK